MVPIVPLQVCETCRGFFCSQGDNELAAGKARLKDMKTGEQTEVALDDSLYTTLYNRSLDRQLADMTDLFSELAETGE